jgi:putative ABC transport system permease protein
MNVWRDARFGLRLLWRSPGFTTAALLALVLGIGANTAIFSVVHATLLAPLPFPDPQQLVMVWSRIRDGRNVSAAGDYLDWRAQASVFQALHAWSTRGVSLTKDGSPEQLQAQVTTPGLVSMMGHRFLKGRDFLPEEGEVGKGQVTILTHRLWQQRFGSDPDIVGRDVRISGKPCTVVGVLAPGPADRVEHQLYLPLSFKPEQINHNFHWLLVAGRLKPGVSLKQANADMALVTRRIAEQNPRSNTGWTASVEPLQNNFLSREAVAGLWLLLGAVGFVLLIACANVGHLLLARGMARQREVAVRSSLGANRRRVFAQFLTESIVLAGLGGALGVALAQVLLGGIMALMPPFTLPSTADVHISMPVLLFTLVVSVLSGILFGCAPAWQATRANLVETLKEGGRASVGSMRHPLRRALIVGEVALALTLLSGGGLAVHSLVKLMNVDVGFQRDHLLTFYLPVPADRLPQPERITAFYDVLREKIQALPGVVSVSASTGMPVSGTNFGMPFEIVGQSIPDRSQRPSCGFNMITPDYFRTFGLKVERGRALDERDRAGSVRVAVVNAAFVKRYLPSVDPLGQRVRLETLIPGVTRLGDAVEWEIVGVYRDVRNDGLRGEGAPEIDVPFDQSPWPGANVAVRTTVDPDSVRTSIAGVVRSLDPDLPLTDVKTMAQLVDETLAGERFSALLFGSFAGVALLLAALGIYGVMSFTVAQRKHEIGLRVALGAGRRQVLAGVLKEGLVTALVGIALGSLGSYLVGRAMQGMWYGVGVIDPAGFSAVAALLLSSALLACLIPARRAASVDPMVALREE